MIMLVLMLIDQTLNKMTNDSCADLDMLHCSPSGAGLQLQTTTAYIGQNLCKCLSYTSHTKIFKRSHQFEVLKQIVDKIRHDRKLQTGLKEATCIQAAEYSTNIFKLFKYRQV